MVESTEHMDSRPRDITPPPLPADPGRLDWLEHDALLGALGRLVRGLSLLFWGLPIALVVCIQSAKGDWFRPLGVVPPVLATGLLLYGVAERIRYARGRQGAICANMVRVCVLAI